MQAALLAIPMELARISSELKAGLAEFHNGSRLTAARYIDVNRGPMAWGGTGRLVGWSVRNAGAEAATLTLRNGRDASDEALAVVELAAGEAQTVWLGPGGVHFGEALYLEVSAGAELVGAVYLGAVD